MSKFLNVCQHLHSGRNTYRIVAVSFGLLCILQVAVNITLRLSRRTTEGPNKSFQQGWVYFGSSLYFISSTKLPWLQSRDDCQQRGVFDFMLKNFMGKFHRLTWIGLTHQAETMKWNWVDGTLLTERNITCVEIRFFEQENSWNDIRCYEQNFWICEKNAL
uniref:C-type lectin domain-containing protein n=1 Tax=Oryzias latipes TaxID=8090 RepID=A0A3P9HS72_ORYLA